VTVAHDAGLAAPYNPVTVEKEPTRRERKTNAAGRETIRVLVANASQMQLQLLTSALRRRPEFEITSCPLDPELILKVMEGISIHVLLLDANNQGSSWQDMALLRRLHVSFPKVAKVLLAEHLDKEFVINAFRSGARGLFCFAVSPFRALCRCIQVVHRGQLWATAQQFNYLIELVTQVPSLRVVNTRGDVLITPREEQVVALVAEGLSNREIAQELGLSEHTVKKYLFRIFEKLGISTRVELVLYAVHHGAHREAEWLSGSA
jgi:DNA-binding NarL/FixJ family response regulator